MWIADSAKTNKINPSYIFLTSIKKYVDKFGPAEVYSVWDKKLIYPSTNYRKDALNIEYKGNRDPAKRENVFKHEELTTNLLNTLGVKNIYPGVLEADDVIAWLSKKLRTEVVIVSVDQDMLQLIDNKTIVYSPIKDVIINETNFEDIVGVSMEQFLRYKSLMGDKSDNLPGVHKCGKKTAKKYVDRYPTDALLVEALGSSINLDPYFNNYKIIDLEQGLKEHPGDVTLYQEQYEKLKKHTPDFEQFEKICKGVNMSKIVSSFHTWQSVFGQKSLNNTLESIVNRLNL